MTHKGTTLCVLALLSCVLRAGVAQGSRHTDVVPPPDTWTARICVSRSAVAAATT